MEEEGSGSGGFAGSIVSGIGSGLIGSLTSGISARKNRQQQQDQFNRSMEFAQDNERYRRYMSEHKYTHGIRTKVADLKAAGLSPTLAVSGGVGSTPPMGSGPQGPSSGHGPKADAQVSNIALGALQAKNLTETILTNQAQRNAIMSQQKKTDSETLQNMFDLAFSQKWGIPKGQKLSESQVLFNAARHTLMKMYNYFGGLWDARKNSKKK